MMVPKHNFDDCGDPHRHMVVTPVKEIRNLRMGKLVVAACASMLDTEEVGELISGIPYRC